MKKFYFRTYFIWDSNAFRSDCYSVLRRLKVGQTEREELESHQIKTGTPTMGGLIILATVVITSLFYISRYPKIIPILFLTVGFGVIGF